MSVTVSIAFATICFFYQGEQECHPVLVGKDTPIGDYVLQKRITDDPGYGGDVLQFHETENEVFAIHRVWTLRKSENREKRLKSTNVKDRYITKGCVNLSNEIYAKLSECCTGQKLTIR